MKDLNNGAYRQEAYVAHISMPVYSVLGITLTCTRLFGGRQCCAFDSFTSLVILV